MKTYTIDDIIYSVYVTNGDATLVECEEDAQDVKAWLENAKSVEEVSGEEFEHANAVLDFSEQVPARRIYAVKCVNPNESGYICLAEDYGD